MGVQIMPPATLVHFMTVGQLLTGGGLYPKICMQPLSTGRGPGPGGLCSFPTAGSGLGSGAGRGHWEERQAHQGEVEWVISTIPGLRKWSFWAPALSLA